MVKKELIFSLKNYIIFLGGFNYFYVFRNISAFIFLESRQLKKLIIIHIIIIILIITILLLFIIINYYKHYIDIVPYVFDLVFYIFS